MKKYEVIRQIGEKEHKVIVECEEVNLTPACVLFFNPLPAVADAQGQLRERIETVHSISLRVFVSFTLLEPDKVLRKV